MGWDDLWEGPPIASGSRGRGTGIDCDDLYEFPRLLGLLGIDLWAVGWDWGSASRRRLGVGIDALADLLLCRCCTLHDGRLKADPDGRLKADSDRPLGDGLGWRGGRPKVFEWVGDLKVFESVGDLTAPGDLPREWSRGVRIGDSPRHSLLCASTTVGLGARNVSVVGFFGGVGALCVFEGDCHRLV